MIHKPTTPKIYTPQDRSCVLNLDARDVRGSKIYDRSGKGNHGAITGAVLKPKNYGVPALDFDGVDDIINCGNDDSFDITDNLTVVAWIKPGIIVGNRFIVGKAHTTFEFRTHSDGVVDFQADRVVAGGTGGRTPVNSISVGKWSFLVFTFSKDIQNMKGEYHSIYVDSILQSLNWIVGADTNEALAVNNNNFFVGARGGTNFFFIGFIGKILILNRLWSPAEISQYFNQSKHLYGK